MFDAGFTELLLIMVIALLVVGPERLPGLARKVGTWVGKARMYVNSVRSDIERELRTEELKQILDKQEEEIRNLKGMMQHATEEIDRQTKDTEYLVKSLDEDKPSSKADESSADNTQASDQESLTDGHHESSDSAPSSESTQTPDDRRP